MTYKEILSKTRIVGDFLYDPPMLAIIKKSENGIAEISECRKLPEQEILQYVWHLSNYLLEKKGKEIWTLSNGKQNLTIKVEEIKGENENA